MWRAEEMFRACVCVCACVCALVAVSSGQLTEEQHQVIVEQHNLRRTQVQPPAEYMRKMSWDESLRIMAEAYAAKCVWDHNPEMDDKGENLYVTTGPLDATVAISKWFLEHEYYNYTSNDCQEDQMCGHYTQVVWADTSKVGCAAHVCEEIEGLDYGKVTILVCNYFPAGNYDGVKPYTEGEFCSSCPDDMPRCEDGLCAPEEEPTEEAGQEEGVGTDTPLPSEDPAAGAEEDTLPEEEGTPPDQDTPQEGQIPLPLEPTSASPAEQDTPAADTDAPPENTDAPPEDSEAPPEEEDSPPEEAPEEAEGPPEPPSSSPSPSTAVEQDISPEDTPSPPEDTPSPAAEDSPVEDTPSPPQDTPSTDPSPAEEDLSPEDNPSSNPSADPISDASPSPVGEHIPPEASPSSDHPSPAGEAGEAGDVGGSEGLSSRAEGGDHLNRVSLKDIMGEVIWEGNIHLFEVTVLKDPQEKEVTVMEDPQEKEVTVMEDRPEKEVVRVIGEDSHQKEVNVVGGDPRGLEEEVVFQEAEMPPPSQAPPVRRGRINIVKTHQIPVVVISGAGHCAWWSGMLLLIGLVACLLA